MHSFAHPDADYRQAADGAGLEVVEIRAWSPGPELVARAPTTSKYQGRKMLTSVVFSKPG